MQSFIPNPCETYYPFLLEGTSKLGLQQQTGKAPTKAVTSLGVHSEKCSRESLKWLIPFKTEQLPPPIHCLGYLNNAFSLSKSNFHCPWSEQTCWFQRLNVCSADSCSCRQCPVNACSKEDCMDSYKYMPRCPCQCCHIESLVEEWLSTGKACLIHIFPPMLLWLVRGKNVILSECT